MASDQTTEPQAGETPSRIVGRRPRRRWTSFGPSAYVCFLGVFQALRGEVALAVLLIVLGVAIALVSFRPPTVVDASGIRRPWRWRRRHIAWGQVDAILAPPPLSSLSPVPRVAIFGVGRPVMLDDIAADQAEVVASIGGRPLRRMPTPGLPTAPPREKFPRDSDVEADVARRAAALKKRWTDLESENRHRPAARARAAETPSTPDE